ncbi:type II toxin-antitoxin system RelE/ParE family toxin [Bradyrhizobium sp.]|uniref:type II toxin-antitoxin system RelE/ParE family toxin n=1 Tax=Bradyrhizobium sp. TaxID=376 RepID=UPI003C71DA21
MRVRYTPEAFSDREQIIEYLGERSAIGARNVAASIRKTVAQLKDHPQSGYRTDDPDVRVIFVARYPYKIFYRVRDEVEILHIRHTSRRAWTGDR